MALPIRTLSRLDKYECHKVVRAAKLLAVEEVHLLEGFPVRLTFDAEELAQYDVPLDWISSKGAHAGGYFVVYEDGYESFSPAKAFEEGYSLLAARPVGPHEKIERIAKACHQVNKAYCEALGDNNHVDWDEAPEWQRESVRMGVDLNLCVDFGVEASHASWMRNKLDDGWVYGAVKDPEKKEHPCLVPFDQLPVDQQAKDFIFRAVVHALKDAR